MPGPNSRQEFLRMQERAIASAREMQRRATLPAPPRPSGNPQAWPQNNQPQQQPQASKPQHPPFAPQQPQQPQWQQQERYAPEPPRRSDLHHPCPGQQARYNASYGRTQPPIRRPAPPPQPEPFPGRGNAAGHGGNRNYPRQGGGQQSAERRGDAPPFAQANRGGTKQAAAQQPKGTQADAGMGSMQDIFRLLSGLGGGGKKNTADNTPLEDFFTDKQEGEGKQEGMDSLLIMVMLMLLKQESADQGLLLALMYIMM